MNWNEPNILKQIQFDGIFTLFQENKPIYHPENLKNLYLKGHINVVLKVLLKIMQILEKESSYVIPSWCELNIEEVVGELTIDQGNAVEKKVEPVKQKKDTAAALFGGFSWDDDE